MGEPPQLVRRFFGGTGGPDAARCARSAASRAACAATIAARLSSALPTGSLLSQIESTPLHAALPGKRMIVHHAHGRPCEALDRPQRGTLIAVAERQRDARGAGARGAADPVHVALRFVGE